MSTAPTTRPPGAPEVTFRALVRKWFEPTSPLGAILIVVVAAVLVRFLTVVLPAHLVIGWK
ncbi:hypothetical protein [Streptomyces sp. NRRL B-24484]|uniref:hypothetical protein n=1 Tax=Streptomyces sp. NRRL B-24484 TaxID=1463833 RepID=UPI0004C17197|nr:hypothetical protein [Streptomyces sp. NRRL B-24484]